MIDLDSRDIWLLNRLISIHPDHKIRFRDGEWFLVDPSGKEFYAQNFLTYSNTYQILCELETRH